jgi:hypothetical protein
MNTKGAKRPQIPEEDLPLNRWDRILQQEEISLPPDREQTKTLLLAVIKSCGRGSRFLLHLGLCRTRDTFPPIIHFFSLSNSLLHSAQQKLQTVKLELDTLIGRNEYLQHELFVRGVIAFEFDGCSVLISPGLLLFLLKNAPAEDCIGLNGVIPYLVRFLHKLILQESRPCLRRLYGIHQVKVPLRRGVTKDSLFENNTPAEGPPFTTFTLSLRCLTEGRYLASLPKEFNSDQERGMEIIPITEEGVQSWL